MIRHDRAVAPVGLPDYPNVTAASIEAATEAGLAAADAALWRVLAPAAGGPASDGSTVDDTIRLLHGISDAARAVWAAYGAGPFLAAVHPDPEIRAAAERSGVRIEGWRAALLRNDVALATLEASDPTGLDPDAAAVRRRWIQAMRLAGAHLDEATRAELERLTERIGELRMAFMGNQGADRAGITVDRKRVADLPGPVLAGLAAGDAPGTVVIPIELRQAVLERVADRGVREAIHRRWFEIAKVANRSVLAEMTSVHRAMARLLGFPSLAALRAAGAMAGDVREVRRFLDELSGPFLMARDEQLARIRRPLARELGIAEDKLVLEDWDVPRGLALLRDELGADGLALREFFPLDAVLDGLRRTMETVFGIRVIEVPGTDGWHPDVRRLDCTDVASGAAIGSILLDPFAREGKITGVAGMCDQLYVGGPGEDGSREPTHTAIVLFLAKPVGDGPVLLAPGDLEALFHELGHALDFMLDRSRFAPIDGAAWVGDWVEAPSQSIGRWAVLPDVLAGLGRHVVTGERLALDRATSFAAANEVGAALANLRLLWASRLDQALHDAEPVDLDRVWREAWPIRGTAPSIDGFSPAPLMIVALGYDGVMYGFLWSQLLLEEIIAQFRADGPLSSTVGAAYRRDLLEPGWAADPLDRMRRFLGRDPSMDPYLAHLRT